MVCSRGGGRTGAALDVVPVPRGDVQQREHGHIVSSHVPGHGDVLVRLLHLGGARLVLCLGAQFVLVPVRRLQDGRASWRTVAQSALVAATIACGHHGPRDAAATWIGAEVTDVTGCYDDSIGPCVRVTILFSNGTPQPVTVDGYRITWPGVPVAPGMAEVGKSVPDVRFRLAPGAVESRSVRLAYLGPDMTPLRRQDARIEILAWH
jgi:hypothetical protein